MTGNDRCSLSADSQMCMGIRYQVLDHVHFPAKQPAVHIRARHHELREIQYLLLPGAVDEEKAPFPEVVAFTCY